jgi:hypothetical protein
MNPWQSKDYAESYKSRHGKYPSGYDPDAQTAPEAGDGDDQRSALLNSRVDPQDQHQDIDEEWHRHRNGKAAEALHPIDPADFLLETEAEPTVLPPEESTHEFGTSRVPPPVTSAAEEIEEAATAAAVEEETSRKSERRELTEECPLYIINRRLANCRVLTSTERCCIGLLNSLMQKHGYAFVSNEQLALWLCMKSPDSVRNMLAKLAKTGFLKDTGRRNLEVRWVVREDLRNPKRTPR